MCTLHTCLLPPHRPRREPREEGRLSSSASCYANAMGQDVELECLCGAVHGVVRDVSAKTANRCVCLCADCQTFLHHLGRAELLDAHGGSEIIQVAPNTISFDRGTDKIAAIRLGPKGPYRWYATCCKTPLGNTVKPSLPRGSGV